jgi:hypothetical protein
MDTTILMRILEIISPILTVIVLGISGIVGFWMSKWQAREKIKAMRSNAESAVTAVEQLYPNLPNEDKSKIALQLAQSWNKTAGIIVSDELQLPMNESKIPELKSKEKEPLVPLG